MKKMIKVTNNKGETYCVIPEKNITQMIEMIEEVARTYPELRTKYEVFNVSEVPFEKLPEEIKDKVKETLKAFNKCSVIYEKRKNIGEKENFSVSVGICLQSKYSPDYFVCGDYKANEIYTEEERRQNYIEVFGN